MSNWGYQGANIQLKYSDKPQSSYYNPNQLGYHSSLIADSRNQKVYQKPVSFAEIPEGVKIFSNVSIISKKANKVLDVCQDKKTVGMLIIYEDFNQSNQRFDIIKCGDSVNIVNKQNGKLLTVQSNSQMNGAPIFQEPTAGLVGQKFRLAKIQNNEYLIHTFCGKVLDCCQQKTSNGTRVIQYQCDRAEHQKWLIK